LTANSGGNIKRYRQVDAEKEIKNIQCMREREMLR
jgi:hypothetical protein